MGKWLTGNGGGRKKGISDRKLPSDIGAGRNGLQKSIRVTRIGGDQGKGGMRGSVVEGTERNLPEVQKLQTISTDKMGFEKALCLGRRKSKA